MDCSFIPSTEAIPWRLRTNCVTLAFCLTARLLHPVRGLKRVATSMTMASGSRSTEPAGLRSPARKRSLSLSITMTGFGREACPPALNDCPIVSPNFARPTRQKKQARNAALSTLRRASGKRTNLQDGACLPRPSHSVRRAGAKNMVRRSRPLALQFFLTMMNRGRRSLRKSKPVSRISAAKPS